MIDDIPSGKRIWELAREAIRIEALAYKEDITREEVYCGILCREADSIRKNLPPPEERFFETLLGTFELSGPVPMDREWEVELRAMEGADGADELGVAARAAICFQAVKQTTQDMEIGL